MQFLSYQIRQRRLLRVSKMSVNNKDFQQNLQRRHVDSFVLLDILIISTKSRIAKSREQFDKLMEQMEQQRQEHNEMEKIMEK